MPAARVRDRRLGLAMTTATKDAGVAVARPFARPSVAFAAAALALVVAHALLVNTFLPLKVVFRNAPIQGFDYDLHIGQVFKVVQALLDSGKSWAYDVQLLAGQPEGTITDSGSKGWEVWTFLLCRVGVPRAIAFNTFVLTMMLSAPLLVYLAGSCFALGRWGSLLAAAMASTLWFFDSHLHWVWFVGMISWSGASCLSLYTLGSFHRFVEGPTQARGVGTGFCLGVCLLIHPYTFFVLAPPLIALYARAFRGLSVRARAGVVGMALLALGMNVFWLHNAAVHWHYILNSAFWAQSSPRHLACDFFDVLCNGADTGVIGTRAGFRFLYFALAVAGLFMFRRERDRRTLPLAAALIATAGYAYIGTYIPGMQQTQPYRHITPAMLLACLPAAAFVTRMGGMLRTAEASIAMRAFLAALGFSLVQLLLATQVLYFFPEFVPHPAKHPNGERSPLSGYGHASHPDLPDHVRYDLPHADSPFDVGTELYIAWFEGHVPPGTRILVQPPVLGERMAWRTKFEVLGGFFERNVMHVDANLFRRYAGRPVTEAELANYLHTFAVEWVVGDRPEFEAAKALLERVPVPGPYAVYRNRLPTSRVLAGGGTVRASQNRLEVTDSAPGEPLVLSYHWHEALRCAPDCRVERLGVAIDRVGFVSIPAPHPAHVVVSNSYRMR
jgi:hypothetical protein